MARRKKEPVETESPELTHNPFAALAGRAEAESLPQAEAPPQPSDAAAPGEAEAAPLRFDRKVVVRRETKGRGGKTVTRIQGLPDAHQDALAQRMKKALGCAASRDGDDLILHGAVVDRAVDWLRAEGAGRVVAGT